MINIQPVDFQWPITGTQEALAIPYNGDITIGQLQDYLLIDQRLGQIVTVAYDNQCQQVLPPHMSLQQCYIPPDCNLYLFKPVQGGQQAAGFDIVINLYNGGAFVGNYQFSNDTTVQETIALLVQNEIIQPNPLSIEVKDLQGNLLFTDQSLKFNSKPIPEYNLYVVYHKLVKFQSGQQATGYDIVINLYNGGAFVDNYQFSNDSTVQEFIALLVQNDIIQPNPLSIEVKDLQGNLLFMDQSLKFNSKPIPEYNLYVVYHELINVNLFNEGAYVGQYFIKHNSTIQETIVLLENKFIPANPTSVEMKVTYSQILTTDQSLKLKFKPVPQYHLHVDYHQIIFNLINEGQYVGQYKISIDATLKQTIDLLVQNNIIPANPTLVEMNDSLNELLSSDLSVSFKSKPLSLYNLYVFY